MKTATSSNRIGVILLYLWAGIVSYDSRGANRTLAATYDGTNSISCADYFVGFSFTTTFSHGSMFEVVGNGAIRLSRLTLPIFESTLGVPPDPANFRLSIVEGDGSFISDRVVWSGTLEGTGPTKENYSIPLHGTVHGGQTYWLLYEQVGFDLGCYYWPFASSPISWCRPDVPPDYGFDAGRFGKDGFPPDGQWYIFPSNIRAAFKIQGGNRPPQAEMIVSPVFNFPGETNLTVILPQNGLGGLKLDGTGSTDEDNEPLHFTWLDGTNVIATTALATNRPAEGTHWISLAVDDGEDAAMKSVQLEIYSAGGAVEHLMAVVQQTGASSRDKQILNKFLANATAAFDGGREQAAVNHLRQFQKMVRTQGRSLDAATAGQLIGIAEEIIKRVN